MPDGAPLPVSDVQIGRAGELAEVPVVVQRTAPPG